MHGACAVPAFRARGLGLRLPWMLRIGALGVTAFLLAGGVANAAPDTAIDVSATVLSTSNCRFRTTAATLAFGTLQPWNPVDVTVTAGLVIRCAGNAAPLATYFISDDDGLHEAGLNAQRLQNTTNAAAFLPYAFSYSPATATIPRNTNTPITVTGTVYGTDYQWADIGDYADTVTLTIVP